MLFGGGPASGVAAVAALVKPARVAAADRTTRVRLSARRRITERPPRGCDRGVTYCEVDTTQATRPRTGDIPTRTPPSPAHPDARLRRPAALRYSDVSRVRVAEWQTR